MSKSLKNVVIFGETGVGKSSLINLLLNNDDDEDDAAKVSDSATGCTFSSKCYETNDHKFFDTVGFNEGSKGTVQAKKAFINIIKLLKSLKDGVHLLIFVIKKGRITKTMEQNYKIFVETICQSSVPTLFVITHCEAERNMGDWYTKEKAVFENEYKMKFSDVISACTTKGKGFHESLGDLYRRRYEETQKAIQDAILKKQLENSWVMMNYAAWFKVVFIDITNKFRFWFGNPLIPMHEPLKAALVEIGHEHKEAVSICNDICRS